MSKEDNPQPAPPRGIRFIRYRELPGVEILDVKGISRVWAWHHETYSFCVATWVENDRFVPWRYRRNTHAMRLDGVQLMEPGELHANLRATPLVDFRVLFLSQDLMMRFAIELGSKRGFPPHLKLAQLYGGPLRSVLRRLTTLLVEDPGVERAEQGLYDLVQELSRQGCFEDSLANPINGPEQRGVELARTFIHSCWTEDVPLRKLAEISKLPVSTLERTFKNAHGTTPRKYLNHVRLMRAKETLQAEGATILATSDRCGFHDPRYFSRLFAREFGCSPSEYQAQTRLMR